MVITPRWDTKGFLQSVQDYRIATTHPVPTMFVRLFELKEQGEAMADLIGERPAANFVRS